MKPHDRLEQALWDHFYLPRWVDVIDRPDLLALRNDRGQPYFNCVYRARATEYRDAEAMVNEVSEFHRDVPSRWQVADTTDIRNLQHALRRKGYVEEVEHDARVIRITDFKLESSSSIEIRRVVDTSTLLDAWWTSDDAFGRTRRTKAQDEIDDELKQCRPDNARVQRFVAYLNGVPVASGGVNLFPDLGFAFLWGGGTVPEARRQGAYTALLHKRLSHVADKNIRYAGLYARCNTSSPIVANLGFEKVGHMSYWTRTIPAQ